MMNCFETNKKIGFVKNKQFMIASEIEKAQNQRRTRKSNHSAHFKNGKLSGMLENQKLVSIMKE